jgi:hypothetical protein
MVIIIMVSIFAGCIRSSSVVKEKGRAKFEPEDGKVILFIGQELESVGGLSEFNSGYLDYFRKPAGWTSYTSISPGDSSFGFVNKGLDGIWETGDWGDGKSNMTMQLSDPDFKNMALAIGLSMVNHEKQIANGTHDEYLIKLGNFLKGLNPRPVFLRIGYEFDGYTWNHYDREAYIASFRRIKDMFDKMGVTNVAYIWQCTGWVSDQYQLEDWYPGNEYVDWCAFSFFSRWKEQEMIEFARKKGKPVFIAEATPTISDYTLKLTGETKETILADSIQAEEAWNRWFIPFFRTINENPDVVKAVCYINCNWMSHPMWRDNPTFSKIDARLQTSNFISEKWKEEVYKKKYIHSSPDMINEFLK